MARAAAQAVAICLQCTGAMCQCLASVVEVTKKAFRVFTKVATCGQGWFGLFANFLTLFNSEEDPDYREFELPVIESRSITDIPFLLLFLTVLGGMMAAMNRSIAFGRPEIYFQGIDSFGNVCGYQNVPVEEAVLSGADMTDFDKLLIFDFITEASVLGSGDVAAMAEIRSKTRICVKGCPEITGSFSCSEYLDSKTQYSESLRNVLCEAAESDLSILREQSVSFSVRNARCVPDVIHRSVSVTKQNEMLNLYSDDWVYNVIADCETCAAELTWITLIATAFTLTFLGIIQSSADNICWVSFSTFTLIGVLSTSAMWYMYYDINSRDTPVLFFDDTEEEILTVGQNDTNPNTTTGMPAADSLPQSGSVIPLVPQAGYSITFRDAAILTTAVTGFFVIVILFVGRKNMEFSALLFKHGAIAMRKVRWIYILPLLTTCAISFATGLLLYTVTRLTAVFLDEVRIVDDPTYNFRTVVMDKDTMYTSWVLLFEFLAAIWLFSFITSCQSLIACSAVCNWYFSKDQRHLYRPMRIGSSRLMRYHLGSAAAGGLLVGYLGWMRAPFSFLQARLNRALVNAEGRETPSLYSRTIELSEVESAKTLSIGKKSGTDVSPYGRNATPQASKGVSEKKSASGTEKLYSDRSKSSQISKIKNNDSYSSLRSDGSRRTDQSKKKKSTSRESTYYEVKGGKSTSTETKPTAVLKCFAHVFVPCFWISNNILVYISDFNFGIVSLKGNSFIKSGYKLRETLLKDPKLKSLGATCSFSLFLGKLSVVMIVLPFGLLFLKDKEGVFIYGYPMAMGALVSYLVAHIFLSLLNAVTGAVFVCLMEDRALNNGTLEKPYFGLPELIRESREILNDPPDEKTLRFASEFRRRRSTKIGSTQSSKSSSSYSSGGGVINKQPTGLATGRHKSSFGYDHSSKFLLMPNSKQGNKRQPVETSSSSASDRLLDKLFEDEFDSIRDRSSQYSDDKRDDDGVDDGLDDQQRERKRRKKRESSRKDKSKNQSKKTDEKKSAQEARKKKASDKTEKKGADAKKSDKKQIKETKKSDGSKTKGGLSKEIPKKDNEGNKESAKTSNSKSHRHGGNSKEKKEGKATGKTPTNEGDSKDTKPKSKHKDKAKGTAADKSDKQDKSKSGKTSVKENNKSSKDSGKADSTVKESMNGQKPDKSKRKEAGKGKTEKVKGAKKEKLKAAKKTKVKATKQSKLGKSPTGMKKPKMEKVKGLKTPKIGTMKAGRRPQRARLKLGLKAGGRKAGKIPFSRKIGGKLAGAATKRATGGIMRKAAKMRKTGKAGKGAGGVAGLVIGGVEGAVNIADGMLRITDKKEDFNKEVHRVAFGTRKRAKTVTAAKAVFDGDPNVFEALDEVDNRFDEEEAYEEQMRMYVKQKRKKEKDHIKKLLDERNALRKRKKRSHK